MFVFSLSLYEAVLVILFKIVPVLLPFKFKLILPLLEYGEVEN